MAAAHFDALYEFDREPVSEDRLIGPGHFAGAFAGEHVAATEFVIGVIVFAILVILMLVWRQVAPRATAWQLETRNPIDLTPWKHAKWASAGLVLVVVAIYVAFAG